MIRFLHGGRLNIQVLPDVEPSTGLFTQSLIRFVCLKQMFDLMKLYSLVSFEERKNTPTMRRYSSIRVTNLKKLKYIPHNHMTRKLMGIDFKII